jgi:peptidoglycan/LPS O-acetylase OafA/YrhL
MISGFLFQHLSDRFNYADYLTKKVKNVIIPYIVISLPGILLLLSKPDFLAQNPELQGTAWLERVAFLYLYSGSQLNYVLWFVPVVTIYYLLAPVFMIFLRRPKLFLVLIVLIPISALEHRTNIQKYHHLEIALYFLSAYMLGMLTGLYRERILLFVDKYIYHLIFLFVFVLLGHLFLSDHVGTYVEHSFSDENGRIDWIFIQKLLLFYVLIGLFKRLENKRYPALDYIATISFAIFFLHIYVLYVYSHLIHWYQYPGNLLNLFALTVITIVFSTGIAYLSRLLFGRSSRLLIGA